MKKPILAAAAFLSIAIACPDHNGLWKRSGESLEYNYEHPEGWGHLKEEYLSCSIGTQQTPLGLTTREGPSRHHTLSFNYPTHMAGYLENSGTSLSYTLSGSDNTTDLPSFSFQRGNASFEEVYLIGWHLHTPSEHKIDGESAMAEMHFVHADAEGNPRSVLGFLIKPSPCNVTQSEFFNQISQPLPSIGSEQQLTMGLDPNLAISDVGGFQNFWAYEGSLTTPPCTQGIQWLVATQPLHVDTDTLQSILAVSMYSARPIQQRWMHRVNE